MKSEPHIIVTKALSTDEGSCNACTRHTDRNGRVPHEVFNVSLRQTSVRLCVSCKAELIEKLTAAT